MALVSSGSGLCSSPTATAGREAFSSDFGAAFDDADRLVLMDVYSAGEAPIPGVGGRTLLETALRHRPRTRAAYLPHRADIVPYLIERVRRG